MSHLLLSALTKLLHNAKHTDRCKLSPCTCGLDATQDTLIARLGLGADYRTVTDQHAISMGWLPAPTEKEI
jgi:hypothetical protein